MEFHAKQKNEIEDAWSYLEEKLSMMKLDTLKDDRVMSTLVEHNNLISMISRTISVKKHANKKLMC